MDIVGKGWVKLTVEQLVQLIVNNGTAVALLIYFIYKDNKFTDSINKSLNAINESLTIIRDNLNTQRCSSSLLSANAERQDMITRRDTNNIEVSAEQSVDSNK